MSYTYFWSEKGDNGIYSNWYPSVIKDGNNVFSNAEMYVAYHKARLSNDEETAEKILHAKSPIILKKLSNSVRPTEDTKWEDNKKHVMLRAVYLKFTQNKELGKRLREERTDAFIYCNPYDKEWGIGFCPKTAKNNEKKWGENLLGRAITMVRIGLTTQGSS